MAQDSKKDATTGKAESATSGAGQTQQSGQSEQGGDKTAPTQFTITITGTGVNPDGDKAREFVQSLSDADMKVTSATFSSGASKESIMPKSQAQKDREAADKERGTTR